MAITKTNFLNYTRCKRYVALEQLKKEALKNPVSYEEYKNAEKLNEMKELYSAMIEVTDEDVLDKTEVVNKQLEAMLPFYKQVEIEAGKLVQKYFGGKTVYALDTQEQVLFQFIENDINYLCYVDIYNETDENINIIEVKATTAKKYLDLAGSHRKGKKYSIFYKQNNIYTLKGEIENYPLEEEMPIETSQKEREKLLDRYKVGQYVHDLSVQRFMIEKQMANDPEKLKKFHYYLAVLNPNYIYDGTKENGKALYSMNNGEELITFFQLDEVTREYQSIILEEQKNMLSWLDELDSSSCNLAQCCGYKTQNCCKYFHPVCASKIPKENSSLNYVNNPFGFVKEDSTRIKGLELINQGYYSMLDIPDNWISRRNHQIQRDCLIRQNTYINKEKIKFALDSLEYPIYHLDFETFPCPLPRFRGEFPYIQSPFEFSLHIENRPNECDKEKDNVVFLAKTMDDEREDLIKCMLEHIDVNKGTLFAQNVAFEKGRIKELAHIFPKYKEDLMKLYDRGFDLLWILNNNKEFYQKLGFSEEDVDTFNFYDSKLSDSFSIKKTLPLFSDLTYKDLEVKNGTEAIVEYARYPYMSLEELKEKQEALRLYCQQDTWAMVEILKELRKKVN